MSILLILFAASASSQEVLGYEPVLITEYVRHGARTTFMNSLNLSFTSLIGVGNLTANGMKMHNILGTVVRKNYPTLFASGKAKYDEVEVMTSSVGRTILSAVSHLLGLFPLGTGDNLTLAADSPYTFPPNVGMNVSDAETFALQNGYKTFPFTIKSPELDLVFFPNLQQSCPDAGIYTNRENLKLHSVYNKLIPSVNEISNDLKQAGFDPVKIFNQKDYTIDKISYLYDEFKSYYNYYGKLPDQVNETLFNKTFQMSNLNFNFLYPDEHISRLYADKAARIMMDGMKAAINNSSPVKFRLLSGHDLGVYSHMQRFNLTNRECLLKWIEAGTKSPPLAGCEILPDFAASFLYELSKKNNEYFVRAFYNGRLIPVCQKVVDQNFCKIDDFEKAYADMMYYGYGDVADFCGNPWYKSYALIGREADKGIKWILAMMIAIFVLLLVGFLLILFREAHIKAWLRGSYVTKPVLDKTNLIADN